PTARARPWRPTAPTRARPRRRRPGGRTRVCGGEAWSARVGGWRHPGRAPRPFPSGGESTRSPSSTHRGRRTPPPRLPWWTQTGAALDRHAGRPGIAHVRATAQAGPGNNGGSNAYAAEVRWEDYVSAVPVDPARAGEHVFFRYRITGSFEVSGNGHDPASSR